MGVVEKPIITEKTKKHLPKDKKKKEEKPQAPAAEKKENKIDNSKNVSAKK